MRKVKIAQIGTNRTSHGIMTFDSLCKQSEVFDLTAVAFPERERERFPEIVERMSAVPEKGVEEILSDPTVELVAEMAGFASSSYFRRVFRHFMCQSPRDYRRALLEALSPSAAAQ